MEYDGRHRRTIFNRALKSKVSRLGTLSAAVTVLLVIALWTVTPARFRPIMIAKDVDIPAYRVPEPKSYDDEPKPPNWKYREKAVKDAFLHAYQAYEHNAFPADELWPLSHEPRQKLAFSHVIHVTNPHI